MDFEVNQPKITWIKTLKLTQNNNALIIINSLYILFEEVNKNGKK